MLQFNVIRNGGKVKRYHTMTMIGEQTVATHTFGVIAIIMELWPDSSPSLIKAAMHHDVLEHFVGDTPAHTKWAFPDIKEAMHDAERALSRQYNLEVPYTTDDLLKLKLADLAELCMTAHDQICMGNRTFEIVFERGVEKIKTFIGITPHVPTVLRLIEQYTEQK